MDASSTNGTAGGSPWLWHPDLPHSPLFAWPPRPLEAAIHVLGRSFLWSPTVMLYVLLSVLTWWSFGPDLARCVEFEIGWIVQIYAIYMASVVLTAGGLHLYFYTFRRQGDERRFDAVDHHKKDAKFLFGYQLWDNVFWTCISGVTIATAYTVVLMWAYANDLIPWLHWDNSVLSAIWFVLLFPLLIIWEGVQFFLVHRLLHMKWLYRWHALHHRNISPGPWSGLSMHPIEHVLYFSNALIHVVVATHPIHMLFTLYYTQLAAITSHVGYEGVRYKGRQLVGLGDFLHQLHHRFFDCNYGAKSIPLDAWFDCLHDGTEEASARLRAGQRAKRQRASA